MSADGHLKGGATARTATTRATCPSPYVQDDGTAHLASPPTRAAPDLVGKALILHAGRNNFGNIPVGSEPNQYTPNSPAATTMTANTGNSGDRIACGVVARRAEAQPRSISSIR